MAYPIRAFIKETQTWHDITRFEIVNGDVRLISTQKDKAFSLFEEVQNIVISPDVLNEIFNNLQNNVKTKLTKATKNTAVLEIE